MHLKFAGVNESFVELVKGIDSGTIQTVRSPSRVGEILQIPEPVILSYSNPKQRVLFNQARGANPFFHLYEALHMLAGRNDIAPLAYYAKQYQAQVDDGGVTANGSYGYRWRKASVFKFENDGETPVNKNQANNWHDYIDQLDYVIEHLKNLPNSRRVVLQMWNVEDDLMNIGGYPAGMGSGKESKDVCCNLSALFSIRKEVEIKLDERRFSSEQEAREVSQSKYNSRDHVRYSTDSRQWLVYNPEVTVNYLDMTVFNRSNDLIWGSLGANFVHFTFLQEYVANCLGIEVGYYHQISNNLHAYTERWYPSEWLADETRNYYQGSLIQTPLVNDRVTFDKEVKEFVDINKNEKEVNGGELWKEPFLNSVAQPMMHAFHMHKQRDYEAAADWMTQVSDNDWGLAGTQWLLKRAENWRAKQNA